MAVTAPFPSNGEDPWGPTIQEWADDVEQSVNAAQTAAAAAVPNTTTGRAGLAASDELVDKFAHLEGDVLVIGGEPVGGASGGITSTTISRIIVSEDPEAVIVDGDLLIVVPSGTLNPDVTAPSTPTGLNATTTGTTTVDLSWAASTDDTAVAGYEYRINSGAAVDAGSGTSESVGGLTPGTLYTFHVRAYDAADNFSAWSSADTATTDTPSGATFQTDFAGMTAEAAPTGWTSRWTAGTTFLVKDDVAVSATKLLRVGTGGGIRTAFSWDADGATEADVEILARWRSVGDSAGGGRLLARGAGSAGAETGILGYVASGGVVTIGRYNNNVASTLTNGTNIGAPGAGVWHRMRMRLVGGTVQLRAWEEPDAEPATWQAEALGVTGVLGAGWVGVMAFNNGTTDYDWISVGHDGAAAPTVA